MGAWAQYLHHEGGPKGHLPPEHIFLQQNAQLIVFDEAIYAFDNATESRVSEELHAHTRETV